VLYGYVWVHLHGFLGILTFVVNLIAFALIVDWVSDREIDHFKGGATIVTAARSHSMTDTTTRTHASPHTHTHTHTLTTARTPY
jgi:hypothetical protein